MYLGAKLRIVTMQNGEKAWSISSSKYVQEAVRNCRAQLAERNSEAKGGRVFSLPKNAPNPFAVGYEAELDPSPELGDSDVHLFQSVVGTLRWMVEIGRVDISTELSILSSYLCAPREGHLEAALYIMAHVGQRHNARLVLDPSYPDLKSIGLQEDPKWKDFYGDVKEAIPPNAPEALGSPVDVRLM